MRNIPRRSYIRRKIIVSVNRGLHTVSVASYNINTIEKQMNEHDTHTVGSLYTELQINLTHTSLPAAFEIHPGKLQTLSAGEASLSRRFNTTKHTSNAMQAMNNNTVVTTNVFRWRT